MLQFIHNDLVLQVPDLDTGIGGSTVDGTEAQGIDDIPTIECIKVLAFIEIPQHSLVIIASRRTEGFIQSNSHCVQIACMANVLVFSLQLARFCTLTSLFQMEMTMKGKSGHKTSILNDSNLTEDGGGVLEQSCFRRCC